MKVTQFELLPCVQANVDPEWRSAIGSNPNREAWLVKLFTDDGAVGYGYAPASRHLGTTYKGVEIELNALTPQVVGADPFEIEPVLAKLDRCLVGASATKSAIDCALHDLAAQSAGVPLYKLLGGKFRDAVPIIRILPLKTPPDMAAEAEKLVGEGYQYLKIKVDGNVKEDVERVRAVRGAVGPEVHLTIDANQAYSTKSAILAINQMLIYGIDIVEQPVQARDYAGLKLVTDSVPIAIEADESAMNLQDVHALIAGRVVDAVSLRIPNLGGLRNTLAVARMCEAASIDYRMGAAVGCRLLAAHSIHLAATLPNLTYASELGEFQHLHNDPFAGMEVENGILRVPSGIGCGVRWIGPGSSHEKSGTAAA
jgi:L-Ala-D/L-Glu epimerase